MEKPCHKDGKECKMIKRTQTAAIVVIVVAVGYLIWRKFFRKDDDNAYVAKKSSIPG